MPRLHLIGDRTLCPLGRYAETARHAVDGGVDAVHLREKDLAGGTLVEAARELRRALAGRALVIVNERVDVALVSGADGVQLPEAGMRPRDARAVAGRRLLIGRSVHDAAGAERAADAGADYVLAGHVYQTRSKPGQAPRGPAFVREIARACPLPVIAVGGITPDRVAEVLDAGAYGVAITSGILAADDPEAAARDYREALEGWDVAERGPDGDHGQR